MRMVAAQLWLAYTRAPKEGAWFWLCRCEIPARATGLKIEIATLRVNLEGAADPKTGEIIHKRHDCGCAKLRATNYLTRG
jgi:hypothetical protein